MWAPRSGPDGPPPPGRLGSVRARLRERRPPGSSGAPGRHPDAAVFPVEQRLRRVLVPAPGRPAPAIRGSPGAEVHGGPGRHRGGDAARSCRGRGVRRTRAQPCGDAARSASRVSGRSPPSPPVGPAGRRVRRVPAGPRDARVSVRVRPRVPGFVPLVWPPALGALAPGVRRGRVPLRHASVQAARKGARAVIRVGWAARERGVRPRRWGPGPEGPPTGPPEPAASKPPPRTPPGSPPYVPTSGGPVPRSVATVPPAPRPVPAAESSGRARDGGALRPSVARGPWPPPLGHPGASKGRSGRWVRERWAARRSLLAGRRPGAPAPLQRRPRAPPIRTRLRAAHPRGSATAPAPPGWGAARLRPRGAGPRCG